MTAHTMPTIAEDERALREALAKGPTPGPYVNGHGEWGANIDAPGSSCYQGISTTDGRVVALVVAHDPELFSNPDTRVNAEFLKACDPDRIARLLAALDAERAKVPQWLPIETAPKDGTTVILAQGKSVFRGYYVVIPFEEKRDMDGRYIDQIDPDEFWMSEDGDVVEPDHWRPQPPLPAPPIPATSPAKD